MSRNMKTGPRRCAGLGALLVRGQPERGTRGRHRPRTGRPGGLLARLLLVGGLVWAPLVASCGGSGGDLSVSDLQQERYFHGGEHQGERVVVRATVAAVHGPAYFELSDEDSRRTRLTVMTNRPTEVHEGDEVRITGTAGQVRLWSPSGQLPYIQDKLYSQRRSMAYVYDAVVLPPPPG